jgi:hypothetical protein
MNDSKRRQGQIKADGTRATPKPVCPKCGEIMVRVSFRGDKNRGRSYIPTGWMCPSPTCDYIVKDYTELKDDEEETETINEVEND